MSTEDLSPAAHAAALAHLRPDAAEVARRHAAYAERVAAYAAHRAAGSARALEAKARRVAMKNARTRGQHDAAARALADLDT